LDFESKGYLVKSDVTELLIDCGVNEHAALKGFMQFLNSKKDN
jgi:hypothetical protein